MGLTYGAYDLNLAGGAVAVQKDGVLLYCNRRPMAVTVKTAFALNRCYEAAYDEVSTLAGSLTARGVLAIPSGSAFAFEDVFESTRDGFRVSRKVRVLRAGDDLGFSTKFSLVMAESADVRDYNCFAPGAWYKQNEFAPDYTVGKDLDCEYFWQKETCYALPLFAMQNISSGEAVSLSRWAADITMRNTEIVQSENNVDPLFTIGSIGMSKPGDTTLNYMYYGYAVRTPSDTRADGLSIDYVYPGCDGQLPAHNYFYGLDFDRKIKTFQRINHPVEVGFEQNYSVALFMCHHDTFQSMMRETWRVCFDRLRDRLFEVDNERHFHHCMDILIRYTRQYGDAYGLPFACQLPDMDISAVSLQFGFVGQQPGIGYQLLRYGDKENHAPAFAKGEGIIDFWANAAMGDSGMPQMCYHPGLGQFEPYPHYIRMMADGIEAILDAYWYLHQKGDERPAWLGFCQKAADWLVRNQNEDGSYCRAYHDDGSIRMDSKSNTPSVIRFLVQFYLLTGNEAYCQAAIRAGEWSYRNACLKMEYRGGTCDNMDIQDKEAGIYALFGFLALYDLTGEPRWLQGAVAAADYTETWTYGWSFPVRAPMQKHPFNRYSISGQSIITIGGGADVYMAACSYSYYRLYLITEDDHYLDFAQFIHKNTRQSNDVDGTVGYAMPGLGHESGDFRDQTLRSHYHWLPWCTFVEVEPTSRLYDTFGCYEIADAQRLGLEERRQRNRIYERLYRP